MRTETSSNPSFSENRLFYEGFESSVWPAVWSLGDSNIFNGADYWGDVNWTSYEYGWSLWCSDEGDMPDRIYDNNMRSYLELYEPINITNYDQVNIVYSRWVKSEASFDYLRAYCSPDGVNWTLMHQFTDTTSYDNWEDAIYYIPDYLNWNFLYLKFDFTSDGSIQKEGAYLDWIEVYGTYNQPNFIDLEPYAPPGFDGPIVVSNVAGTGQTTPLTSGQNAYVDWHIRNTGDTVAESFHVGLYVDGSLEGQWWVTNLWPGQSIGVTDFTMSATSGAHTLTLKIDELFEVNDVDRDDNYYSEQFFWSTPILAYSGQVFYQDMLPYSQQKPARNIKIELWDDDWPSSDDLLDMNITDANGNFSLGPIDVNEEFPFGAQDPYFKIYAENYACIVNTEYNGSRWKYSTDYLQGISAGFYDTVIIIPQDASEGFNVADAIATGWNLWEWFRPSDPLPIVQLVISSDSTYSYHSDLFNFIHIENARNDSVATPDALDDGVILHEYGHYIEHAFGFFDSSSGGNHNWLYHYDSKLAASEGFATFLSCLFQLSDTLKNYYLPYQDQWYSWINCENGETGANFSNIRYTANNQKATNEGAVAGMLWDIFDPDNDDYSSFDSTDLTDFSIPDGVGDTISLGVDELLECLVDRDYAGRPVKDIHELFRVWFTGTPSFGHSRGMRSIWYEHGVDKCCIGFRGNVNSDAAEAVNILDCNYLISYFFAGGQRPLCMDEADVDGNGAFNILDVTYLTTYVTANGPPPGECPNLAK